MVRWGTEVKKKNSPRSFNRQTFNWKKQKSNDRDWERPSYPAINVSVRSHCRCCRIRPRYVSNS
jgi:hypothetical protein